MSCWEHLNMLNSGRDHKTSRIISDVAMDNLEPIIKTIATQNDEIIDFNLNTHVYENNGISISSRSMSKDELKRFKNYLEETMETEFFRQ